jgi:DNA-binding NtrC family response regulator
VALALTACMDPQFANLVWANPGMRKLEDEMRCASQTDVNVMLSGENGVGKRSAADMIHQLSHRRRSPFVVINAADVLDVPPAPKGTAAWPVTEGFLRAADDGTLLIQDIENIPASAQMQLLRFMDRAATVKRRPRLMTATSSHLFDLVQAGAFRDDLFYRLNVLRFDIPPLRERPEDIPLMFNHYLSLHARAEAPRLSSAARQRLVEYSWPGNIRELRTVTKHLTEEGLPSLIEPEHLPSPIGDHHSRDRERRLPLQAGVRRSRSGSPSI